MQNPVKRFLVLAMLLAASGCIAEPGAENYDAGRPYDYGPQWDYGPTYYPSERSGFYRGRGHDWDRDRDRGERHGGPPGPLGLPNPMRPFSHFP
jgi:hypothetical protein